MPRSRNVDRVSRLQTKGQTDNGQRTAHWSVPEFPRSRLFIISFARDKGDPDALLVVSTLNYRLLPPNVRETDLSPSKIEIDRK